MAGLKRAEQLSGALGPYTLQAAIAACHARARSAEETDWARIAALYESLATVVPSPVVELNRAVAVAMAFGPAAGLELVDALLARVDPEGVVEHVVGEQGLVTAFLLNVALVFLTVNVRSVEPSSHTGTAPSSSSGYSIVRMLSPPTCTLPCSRPTRAGCRCWR